MGRNRLSLVVVHLVAVGVLVSTGCSTMNNTERGTLGGAGIGSVAGALIGGATGNPKTGAVVGALGGGLVGNLIGQDADRQEARQAEVRQAVAEQAYSDDQPTRIAEVIDLTRNGQDDTVILNHIKANHMTFSLSVSDLNTLKANGVSPAVITAMQNSSKPVVVNPTPKTVVVQEPVIVHEPVFVHHHPRPPVVFVDPYCPPTRMHIRGGFHW